MDDVRDRVRRVARFNSSVLLLGQSGTGKEIVANAVHYNSPRREKPFIKVNCAAIPEHLLESELFGIERNVATGVDGRVGRFELADGGTLFLDEIGDMSLSTQAKILRVLQEREFERVGGKKVIKVDVRIIAATNKDLEAEIQARRFREDLYYRLNVIVIALPPLSQRHEDIDPLIDHFLERFTQENGLPRKRLSLPARLVLNEYDWPGNVRELEHCIERAVIMSEENEIGESDLPPGILIWKEMGGSATSGAPGKGGLSHILRQVERRAVLEALERSGGVQARAARLLGISERSMWYRVKKLGLQNQVS
jgi:transcriptional regulator with GAF, ATPase, and Fis domain